MLKLEKKSHHCPVNVSLRDSGRLLTPNFLRALALAIGVHLLWLVIFQVKPFRIRYAETVFPPTQVNVDFAQGQDGTALAQLEGESLTSQPFLEPELSSPELPQMQQATLKRDLAYPKSTLFPDDPFSLIEERINTYDLLSFSSSSSSIGKSPIIVKVSGELATRKLLNKEWNIQELLTRYSDGKKQIVAAYHVKVEEKTGKIFWHVLSEPLEKKKLGEIGETVLDQIQFQPNPQGFISSGTVEIAFTLEDRDYD